MYFRTGIFAARIGTGVVFAKNSVITEYRGIVRDAAQFQAAYPTGKAEYVLEVQLRQENFFIDACNSTHGVARYIKRTRKTSYLQFLAMRSLSNQAILVI